MSFKYYGSEFVGATKLSTSTTDAAVIYAAMVSVFRSCLVDGYGVVSGAGWSEPFPVGPDGEVFFKSPSTEHNWGVRLDGVGGTGIDTGQVRATLMFDATDISTSTKSYQFALNTRWVTGAAPRQSEWAMYVHSGSILFCGKTVTTTQTVFVPAFFGLTKEGKPVIESPTTGSGVNTSATTQNPLAIAPLSVSFSNRLGRVFVDNGWASTRLISSPLITSAGVTASTPPTPTPINGFDLYPIRVLEHSSPFTQFGVLSDKIFYIDVAESAFPGNSRFSDQNGNNYHMIRVNCGPFSTDPLDASYNRLVVVKVE